MHSLPMTSLIQYNNLNLATTQNVMQPLLVSKISCSVRHCPLKPEQEKTCSNVIWSKTYGYRRQCLQPQIIVERSQTKTSCLCQNRFLALFKTIVGTLNSAFRLIRVIAINGTDKRQYSSIAYSLRALLAVQQESLLATTPTSLPPLTPEAIEELKDTSDLYTLAVLKISDTYARQNNLREIPEKLLSRVWLDLGAGEIIAVSGDVEGDAVIPSPQPPSTVGVPITQQIIDQKVASYAAYNAISNPLFVRNLQVYFAKRRWPAESQEAQQFRRDFTEALIAQAGSIYMGAQSEAIIEKRPLIREAHVQRAVQSVLPHKANEYEDIVFFPHLPPNEQIVIEAYDIDAFRDSGVHWRYLQYALEDSGDVQLEADPFALELITESIANIGVLMLRLAGQVGIDEERERLAASDIAVAITQIAALTEQDRQIGQALVDAPLPKVVSASSTASQELTDSSYFQDITEASGVRFMHRSSNWLSRQLRTYLEKDETTGITTIPPAFGGGGAAAGDIDSDGDQDLLLVGGLGNALFINQGTGTFIEQASVRGLGWVRADGMPGEPRQPLIADLDNDGHQDIVVTFVDDRHRVYKNRGDGSFDDVTNTASLGGEGLVGGPATIVDVNNDGLLDIYITYFGNYLNGTLPTLARRNTNGLPNRLFLNQGNFKFTDMTEASGLGNIGWGQAVTHTDFTGDGLQDIIAGNDFGVNAYYRNNGDTTFTDISNDIGTGKPSYTMGIGLSDLNGDQLPDVYISNIVTMNKDQKYVLPGADTPAVFDPEKLANMRVIEANDLFLSNTTADRKLANFQMSNAVQRGYAETGWSWGAEFFDADHDGDDDLYVLNGMNEFHVYSSDNPYYTDPLSNENKDVYIPVSQREQNVFFINDTGRLNITTDASGLGDLGNSRALLTVDLDNDGDLDLVVNNYHGAAKIYRNELPIKPSQSVFVSVQGNPEHGVNLDGIGTQVIAHLKSGSKIWREIRGSGGYMSVQPKRLHFGQAADKFLQLDIIWPNGKQQRVPGPFTHHAIDVTYQPD